MKQLWIDTETTGTDPQKHAVVQIAGIIVRPDREDCTFNLTLRPFDGDAIEDAALAVTGLTREQVASYPDPLAVKKGLEEIFAVDVSKFDRSDKFVMFGYNALFDYNFLHRLWAKCGDKYFGSWVHFPPVDVMNLAAHFLAEERHKHANFKLATVAASFGITPEGDLHDALTDIRLTRALYHALCKERLS